MKRLIPCVASALAISVGGLSAHHSIATVYDSNQSVRIDATVVEFQFVNPHPLITVAVKDPAGNEQQWRLEMDNRSELAGVGFTSQTLQRGDRVVVSGSRSRTERTRLYIRRLDRPADGFWYEQVGGSPKTSLRSR
jgi:hypothetical protein